MDVPHPPSGGATHRDRRRGRIPRRRRLLRSSVALVVLAAAVVAVVVTLGVGAGTRSPRHRASTQGEPKKTAPTTTTQLTASAPYPVADSTATFVDPTRGTPERGDVPATDSRVLQTVIRKPIGRAGPLPLVVFAHGWDSDPSVYESLLDTWAAAGYLVAAPIFPDSSDTLPGTPVNDFPDEARDLSFVITSLLGGVAGPVDPQRIAVAGHSDGGTDVALLALDPAYRDPRIRAYLSLSSQIPPGVPGPFDAPTTGSLLVAVGTDDEYGLFPDSTQVYRTADMCKAMLTVSGGDHLDTYLANTSEAAAMRAETVRFLAVALGRQNPTPATLDAALEPPGDPSITVSVGQGQGPGAT